MLKHRAILVLSLVALLMGMAPQPVGAATYHPLSTKSPQRPVSERFVPAGDVQLFVRSVGGRPNGPTLIMINGGPGLSHDYLEPLERLASTRLRVVTYDQRGTGRSSYPAPIAFALTDHVRDLDAVRAALGVEQVHLLGHSFGGLVAQAYTATYPRRVASLTLAASEPADPQADELGAQRRNQRTAELIAAGTTPIPLPPFVGDDCTAWFVALLPAFFADPDFVRPPGNLEFTCRLSVLDLTFRGLTAEVRAKVLTGLRHYRGPALIVMGAGDVFGIEWGVDANREALPAAEVRVAVLKGAGHFPWLESKRFVPVVSSFLNRHPMSNP
jgi:pimeloyl-ACP methyl ester carboxylesterase